MVGNLQGLLGVGRLQGTRSVHIELAVDLNLYF